MKNNSMAKASMILGIAAFWVLPYIVNVGAHFHLSMRTEQWMEAQQNDY